MTLKLTKEIQVPVGTAREILDAKYPDLLKEIEICNKSIVDFQKRLVELFPVQQEQLLKCSEHRVMAQAQNLLQNYLVLRSYYAFAEELRNSFLKKTGGLVQLIRDKQIYDEDDAVNDLEETINSIMELHFDSMILDELNNFDKLSNLINRVKPYIDINDFVVMRSFFSDAIHSMSYKEVRLIVVNVGPQAEILWKYSLHDDYPKEVNSIEFVL